MDVNLDAGQEGLEKPLTEKNSNLVAPHSVSKLPVFGGTNLKSIPKDSQTMKRKISQDGDAPNPQEAGQACKRAKLEDSISPDVGNGSVAPTKTAVGASKASRLASAKAKLGGRPIRSDQEKGKTSGLAAVKSGVQVKGPPMKPSTMTRTGPLTKAGTLTRSNSQENAASNSSMFKLPSQPASSAAAAPRPAGVKKRPAWDTKGRLEDMEVSLAKYSEKNDNLQQMIFLSNERIASLETVNFQLSGTIKEKEQQTTEASGEIQMLQRKLKERENELESTVSQWKRQVADLDLEKGILERKKSSLETELASLQAELKGLKVVVSEMASTQTCLESQLSAVKIKLSTAESINCDKDKEIESLKATVANNLQTIDEANAKIRADETVRRKLHNTILELKGNIRVFCRVRPLLGDELLGTNGDISHMRFPDDHKVLELEKLGDVNPNESVAAFRKGTSNKYEFSFDRVFNPSASQMEVFEEISQLVQSALDGYNVCIFAYGQTGSGKTFTMEGPDDPVKEDLGMIPRAVEQVFQTAKELTEKGWKYDFEVSFLEIYNETIRDLLGNSKNDVKHEIRLAMANSNEIMVTDLNTVKVTDPQQTKDLLAKAGHNRSVAATNCNERSSRSHSVFRMKITGKNSQTEETCSGLLNLIDLAGSERLKESGSQGPRLRETQSINKSLANLGNVIMALANKESHVPYRNSKLTHLLQNCLGGSSKTLMFVNVSPKEDCFNETLNSLRFAAKVNECNIGTAQKKLK